jgi:hypothetical protein
VEVQVSTSQFDAFFKFEVFIFSFSNCRFFMDPEYHKYFAHNIGQVTERIKDQAKSTDTTIVVSDA